MSALFSAHDSILFQFAIIGDTQYADVDDGSNFAKTLIRRHRQSLEIFMKALNAFQSKRITTVVHVGDVIDGRCAQDGSGEQCMSLIIDMARSVPSQDWHFCLGNHDLYSISRQRFYDIAISDQMKALCSPNKLYYDFSPYSGIRFIFLDSFDVSSIAPSSVRHGDIAERILTSKNPNIRHQRGGNWFDGLSEEDKKYCPYNGAMGVRQLSWAREALSRALDNHELCFLFSHIPLSEACSSSADILWNNEEVLDLLHEFPHIAAYIAGHSHVGGYSRDSHGIHHIVPTAPIECDVLQDAFGVIAVYKSYFQIQWTGKLPSAGDTDKWLEKMPFTFELID